jgi:DNA gyrase subunit A
MFGRGRTAHGVRGFLLYKVDTLCPWIRSGKRWVLTATEKAWAKNLASEYRSQARAARRHQLKVTERPAGFGALVLLPQQEIILITAVGLIIRLTAEGISKFGRNAQGVRLINLNESDKVVAIASVDSEVEEE